MLRIWPLRGANLVSERDILTIRDKIFFGDTIFFLSCRRRLNVAPTILLISSLQGHFWKELKDHE